MSDVNPEADKNEEKSKLALLAKKTGSTILGCHLFFFLLVLKYSSWWRRNLIFAHYIHWPKPFQIDFNKPESCNVKGIRNFYLESEENVKIGVWQILPKSSISSDGNSPESFEECLSDGKPIIVYAHGNSADRGSAHRIELYNRLQENDFHVVSFDYRSFGDSSPVPPDEEGVVRDAITVIKWVLQRKGSSKVFVWGHSLGTGVGSRAVKTLEEEGISVDGLILESPFNNLKDEIRNHPLGLPLKHMIGFNYLFVQPLLDSGISFQSDVYLSQCRVPVLILHADDDWIVPATLGRRLYEYVKKHRKEGAETVNHVRLKNKYGHKWICRCPSLMTLIKSFVEQKYNEIPSCVED